MTMTTSPPRFGRRLTAAACVLAVGLSGCNTMPRVAQALGGPAPAQPSYPAQPAITTQALGPGGCKPVYPTTLTKTEAVAGGALTGALVGALLGRALGGGRVATRNVAIAGAIFGGGAGAAYADQINATEQADGSIKLDIPSKVLFAFGSDKVTPGFESALQQIAGKMMEFCDVTARVVGHTDNIGPIPANEALSLRRATNVQTLLRERGMQRTIMTEGRGPHYPVASNTTDDGRATNRRVELYMVPPPPPRY